MKKNPTTRVVLALCTFAYVVALSPIAQAQAPVKTNTPTATDQMYALRAKGMKALASGFFPAATRFFQDYRKATGQKDPDFADASILLARALIRGGRPQEAQQALDLHAKHSQGLSDPYFKNALTLCRASTLLALGKYQQSIAEAAKALNVTPPANPEQRLLALEVTSSAYVRLKKWQEAEATLLGLLAQNPSENQALKAQTNLLKIYLATKQNAKLDGLIVQIGKSYKNAPELLLKRYRVLVELAQSNVDTAYEVYGTFANDRPLHPDADWYFMTSQLATTLLRSGKNAEAVIVLGHAQKLALNEDDRTQCILLTAEAQIKMKKDTLAIYTLETFRKEYPNRLEVVPVMLKLAELLRSAKKLELAIAYFNQIAENVKAAVGFRYRASIECGWCQRDSDRFDQAAKTFLQAETLGTTAQQKAEAVSLVGDTLYQVSNFTEAAVQYGHLADAYPKTSLAIKGRQLQARSLYRAKLYKEAVASYERFLADFPSSAFAPEALLEMGVSIHKSATDVKGHERALGTLRRFVAKYPTSPLAPQALLEGAGAACGAERIPDAIDALTRLIDGYADSARYPTALYERAKLNFRRADYDQAIVDCNRFVEKYPLLPLTVDVLMWLGDHYANLENYEESKAAYQRVVNTHPQSEFVPDALYEAAACAYHLNVPETAVSLIQQLRTLETPKPSDLVLAKAELLHGDILATTGDFRKAANHFGRARELAGDMSQGIAALGRQGEMLYALAATDQNYLSEAIVCFSKVRELAPPQSPLWEASTYRLAKAYEKQGLTDDAVTKYLDIIYQYEDDISKERLRDWFYFARSGYDAARLLETAGGVSNVRMAARIYERLVRAKIPTADDAAKKAAEIRNTHGLKN